MLQALYIRFDAVLRRLPALRACRWDDSFHRWAGYAGLADAAVRTGLLAAPHLLTH